MNPSKLSANEGKSFLGSKMYGQGFTFDDTDTRGAANRLALMDELISKDPRNAERIFPYIGGEEVNDSPTHVAPPLRHQLRRDERGGGKDVAGLDGDRGGESKARIA